MTTAITGNMLLPRRIQSTGGTAPLAAIDDGHGNWSIVKDQKQIFNTPDDRIIWLENGSEDSLMEELLERHPGGPDYTYVKVDKSYDGTKYRVSKKAWYVGKDLGRAMELAHQLGGINFDQETYRTFKGLVNMPEGEQEKQLGGALVLHNWGGGWPGIKVLNRKSLSNTLARRRERMAKKGKYHWYVLRDIFGSHIIPALQESLKTTCMGHLKLWQGDLWQSGRPGVKKGIIQFTQIIRTIEKKATWRRKPSYRDLIKELKVGVRVNLKSEDELDRKFARWIQRECREMRIR